MMDGEISLQRDALRSRRARRGISVSSTLVAQQLVVILQLLLLLGGCRSEPVSPPTISPQTPPQTLRIGLASSATAVAELVTAPFAQVTDRAVLQFVVGNEAALLNDLAAGALDAVVLHHLPAGHELWFNAVAVDGLVVAVHPENPVTDLSRGEVQALFNGRITGWAALAGAEQPVTLISRGAGSGSRAIFVQRIMAEQRVNINAQVMADDAALRAAIAADPGAVGFSMMGNVLGVKTLTIEGVAATPAETAAQRYPLTVPLYFAAPVEPSGELRAFLAWLQSDEGQEILGTKYGRVR